VGLPPRRRQRLAQALWITAVLGVMEVSLSFDNAVVNASVLRHWNEFWRKLFLTVGILIAVFGMRLVFPLLIVSMATGLGLIDVWHMATTTPEEYSRHLTGAHAEVAAFGGAFLLLVFLNFLFDDQKNCTGWAGWKRNWASTAPKACRCCWRWRQCSAAWRWWPRTSNTKC
jgi:hypothetical protein